MKHIQMGYALSVHLYALYLYLKHLVIQKLLLILPTQCTYTPILSTESKPYKPQYKFYDSHIGILQIPLKGKCESGFHDGLRPFRGLRQDQPSGTKELSLAQVKQ